MKTLYVCDTCRSTDVMRDAWVPVNDPEAVQTFDNTFCCECDGECDLISVEVSDDFDIFTDTVPEDK